MKRLLLIILIAFLSLPVLAQQRWGGGVDYEKIHFGFSFHYVSSSFKVFSNQDQILLPSGQVLQRYQIQSPLKGGVGLGLLSDLRLRENADLRFSPTILFAKKQLDFKIYDFKESDLSKTVKASLLELPLTFKFKSDRRDNYRIYLLGGGKYSRNIIPKSKSDDSDSLPNEKLVKLKPGFLSYEFGLGVDIYFEYFKMSPEIKWSQSIGNVLNKKDVNAFNTPIDKLLLRSIQFSLIFE
jgi:hypothetical protein